MPNETWDIEDAGYDSEAHDAHSLAQHRSRAVEYADRLGIYAVPIRHAKTLYWRPRTARGRDPDLGWWLKTRPIIHGWLSWADAVVAYGSYLEEMAGTDTDKRSAKCTQP